MCHDKTHTNNRQTRAISCLTKNKFKVASAENRRQWHKHLPLAVLNCNITYHTSFGCQPTRVLHGRKPHNVLYHKLGISPNVKFLPKTDFAEELQRKTQILIDQTKRNVMQPYLKYKEYYKRKARAIPLKEEDFGLFYKLKGTIK